MTLNVGQEFKKRWLDAPDAVRQTILEELNRICDLLTPTSQVAHWLDQDQRAMQIAQLTIEQAYADLKTELIEAARLRKQQALEQSLLEKRAQQQAYADQLQQDEIEQFQQQTLALNTLRQMLDHETTTYSARYHKNPEQDAENLAPQPISDKQISTELDSIRLRLELEAESFIEQAMHAFKEKLHIAAQEEIQYILQQAQNSDKNY